MRDLRSLASLLGLDLPLPPLVSSVQKGPEEFGWQECGHLGLRALLPHVCEGELGPLAVSRDYHLLLCLRLLVLKAKPRRKQEGLRSIAASLNNKGN